MHPRSPLCRATGGVDAVHEKEVRFSRLALTFRPLSSKGLSGTPFRGVAMSTWELERSHTFKVSLVWCKVIPHGPMAPWTSHRQVPIGGVLGNNKGVPSAPVLHATPTPCIPTSLDQVGRALGPMADGYGVSFLSAPNISNDLSATSWDASSLGECASRQ